jgi:hypothetical protein
MPPDPPAVEETLGAAAAGRVCGALAVGAGNGLLWIADEDFLETELVTSPGGALREENRLSLAKREDSELQLTRAKAVAAVSARRDQGSERMGSATQRMGPLTRLHTRNERVKHSPVNNF